MLFEGFADPARQRVSHEVGELREGGRRADEGSAVAGTKDQELAGMHLQQGEACSRPETPVRANTRNASRLGGERRAWIARDS